MPTTELAAKSRDWFKRRWETRFSANVADDPLGITLIVAERAMLTMKLLNKKVGSLNGYKDSTHKIVQKEI
jgi:hypothetical protein